MICKEMMLLISGHLDQENTNEEETRLQMHLQECPGCRAWLEQLRGQDQAIRGLTQEAPAGLCGSVMQAIAREKTRKKKRHSPWRAVAMAAALVAVIGIGTLALPKTAAPTGSEDAAVATAAEENAQPISLQMPEVRVYSAPKEDCFSLALEIAEARGAEVVWLEALPADVEVSAKETVAEGWLLYTLPAADTAAQLSLQYQAELSRPTEPDPACTVSYALIKES